MLGFIRNYNLKRLQAQMQRRCPGLAIRLHPEMPISCMNSVAAVAPLVWRVNGFEKALRDLSDEQLAQKTAYFRASVAQKSQELQPQIEELHELYESVSMPEEKDKIKERLKSVRNRIFEGILPEAFAVVREASRRTIGLRHFDVQIAGGIILHEGKIAEMATGEGKTLVATLPAYLNALLGKGVHVITVNDYLAKRDSEWMGPVYQFLGLSVGVIQHDMSDQQRQQAYGCDITYGTNNEFGFDYLRDNMKYRMQDLVQHGFFYAIVDEVDSILIDEARTPLIISGATDESTDKYYDANRIASGLRGVRVTENDEIDAKQKGLDLSKGYDYKADEKANTISLTEDGESKVARLWGVPNLHSIETMEHKHHIIQALRAKEFFKLDTEYIVKDGQVIIVDEFTGRLMPGRRWSDGLHQAIEAKEGLKIEQENQTLATITFQNYFRMYEKLSGMTGTAYTEANEFKAIYKLDVVAVPTNRDLVRRNFADLVFKTEEEKFAAVVAEILELHALGRPVLVGTISIDKSERLSQLLRRKGVEHQVLNAKYHEMEAQIVAQAGKFKGVTIATNMAGRGTDILLGGNAEFMARHLASQQKSEDQAAADSYEKFLERFKVQTRQEHEEVVRLGGLHVIGTERHESRRIDNQLRGRCGRQGDPGSSRFYVSFEDELMRLFAPEWIVRLLSSVETDGEPLTLKEGKMAGMITKSIETAQRRVEQHNFEVRKQLLEYDNVMNKQREVIYGQRRAILEGISIKEDLSAMVGRTVEHLVSSHVPANAAEITGQIKESLKESVAGHFGYTLPSSVLASGAKERLCEDISAALVAVYEEKEKAVGVEVLRDLERMVFLQIIDSKWKDHLYSMDKLREGIGLRAYGHRDPLIEYKNEAFAGFSQMIAGIEEDALEMLFKVELAKPQRFKGVFDSGRQQMSHPPMQPPVKEQAPAGRPAVAAQPPAAQDHPKVGRNDPCPCGSGKKYKKCCGA